MRKLILALALLLPGAALGQGLLIAPVKLLDTSHEVRDQRAEHTRRQALLAEVLATQMQASLLPADAVARACPRETAECLVTLMQDRHAKRGLFIVVQKSSTLILQVFASVVDLQAGKLVIHRELTFRGDNDESWRRAGVFLARQLRG